MWGPTRRGDLAPWIPAAVLGGALANLLDRLLSGSVQDFLATPWVVFNLADVAVIAGLIGLVVTRRRSTRISTSSVGEVIPCEASVNARLTVVVAFAPVAYLILETAPRTRI